MRHPHFRPKSIIWRLVYGFTPLWPIPDKGLKKRIHRIRVPTLLVWGTEDRIVPPVYAAEFARRIPGARVETVDRAGHAPHLERPETIARLVRDFLRE